MVNIPGEFLAAYMDEGVIMILQIIMVELMVKNNLTIY